MGLKNPAADDVLYALVLAQSRVDLAFYAHALDRMLTGNAYTVPHWYIPYDRTLAWNKFGRPKNHCSQMLFENASVIVEARQVRDDVDIFVSDDGVGMTEEIQRRALDPFFTTRRNEGGTGLGLHIIFNLVTQQLGGRLTLRIEAGLGHAISHHHAARSAGRIAADAGRTNHGQSSWLTDDIVHLIDESGRRASGDRVRAGRSPSSTTSRPCTTARASRCTTTV